MDMEETGDASFVEVWECSDGEDEDINEPNRGTVPVQEMTPASLILLKFMVIFLLSWQAIFVYRMLLWILLSSLWEFFFTN